MATLLLSQGVPMICGGDELGHSQMGSNNAYCQDNDLTWFDWDLDERRQQVPRLRRQARPDPPHPAGLPAPAVLQGAADPRRQGPDLARRRRDRDGRVRLGLRAHQGRRRPPGGRPDRRRRRGWRPDRRRDGHHPHERPPRRRPLQAARRTRRTALGEDDRHRRPRRRGQLPRRRGRLPARRAKSCRSSAFATARKRPAR